MEHARLQFEQDRDPRELIFQFNTRFLVYFAVDHFNVLMTTKLAKTELTFFLLTRDLTVLVMSETQETHQILMDIRLLIYGRVYSQVISYWILLNDL